MATITDNDLKMFQERARNELTGRGTGSIAWDSVIWDLCHEVRKLRSASKELGDAAKLREALVKCREIALQWQADEAAGVAGTTDKPHARSAAEAVVDMEFEINAALAATPRNCDVYTSDELKVKFNSELASELPIANEHEKNLVAITAMGVIDTLFAPATEQEGGSDGNE